MKAYAQRLWARIAGHAERSELTPGELYRRMSADFRVDRPPGHGGCIMPMVVFRHTRGTIANWGVEPLTSYCPECAALARRIARRYSRRYNLRVLGIAQGEAAPSQGAFEAIVDAARV